MADSVFIQGYHSRVKNITDEVAMLCTDESLNVVRDPLEIFQTILETLKKSSSMIITEDY